jgi:hypothetical protein
MFGGDDFKYPASHKLGMQVPTGGSMCDNCRFLGDDQKTCKHPEWIKWNGGDNKLPFPDENYCCDLWISAKLLKKPKPENEEEENEG